VLSCQLANGIVIPHEAFTIADGRRVRHIVWRAQAPHSRELRLALGAAVVALDCAASGTHARIRVPAFGWESMLKVPFTW
jgi:hypothetical protein